MTGRDDCYRPPAIRALCRIIDSGMLQTIERYMKQAIVDKVPAVSSAALVSSLHLIRKSPEVVRRWVIPGTRCCVLLDADPYHKRFNN